ncbi:MAG: hypothetical protein QE487_19160 [Fluviicola sp.]|nr:hypothetical protein [Fluviicola sp.]
MKLRVKSHLWLIRGSLAFSFLMMTFTCICQTNSSVEDSSYAESILRRINIEEQKTPINSASNNVTISRLDVRRLTCLYVKAAYSRKKFRKSKPFKFIEKENLWVIFADPPLKNGRKETLVGGDVELIIDKHTGGLLYIGTSR